MGGKFKVTIQKALNCFIAFRPLIFAHWLRMSVHIITRDRYISLRGLSSSASLLSWLIIFISKEVCKLNQHSISSLTGYKTNFSNICVALKSLFLFSSLSRKVCWRDNPHTCSKSIKFLTKTFSINCLIRIQFKWCMKRICEDFMTWLLSLSSHIKWQNWPAKKKSSHAVHWILNYIIFATVNIFIAVNHWTMPA